MHQGNAQQTTIDSMLITLHICTARLHNFFNSARTLSEQPALGPCLVLLLECSQCLEYTEGTKNFCLVMQRLTYHEYMKCFKTKWLRLTYIAMLILSVKFIIQLWMCIKLSDHYNVTYSESITCRRFRIALFRWK